MFPAEPNVALPVSIRTSPLLAECAVTMATRPLCSSLEAPLEMITSPPSSCAELPAFKSRLPPAASTLRPTLRVTPPAAFPSPVCAEIVPLDVSPRPDAISIDPLAPVGPAADVKNDTFPLELASLPPLVKDREPPDTLDPTPAPAAIETLPPTPDPPLPTCNVIDPALPPVEAPVDICRSPLYPAVARPV